MKMLQQHMLEQHSRHFCSICIKVRRSSARARWMAHAATDRQRHTEAQKLMWPCVRKARNRRAGTVSSLKCAASVCILQGRLSLVRCA